MLAPLVFLTLAVAPEVPALSDAQLDQFLQPIHASTDPKVRLEAAKKVALLGPEAYPAMVKRLEQPKKSRPEDFRRLFLEMWAQVPNWKTGDPMWIRKPEPK